VRYQNTKEDYGLVTILLHWLMAALVFGMFGLGVYMVDLTYVDSWYKKAPAAHIGLGILLFFLFVFRLLWRLFNVKPELIGSPFEQKAGLLVHRMHYGFMFFEMVSGYLTVTAGGRGVDVFSWFEVPALFPPEKGREETAGLAHQFLAWAFMGFVALHAAAALKHHFINKDRTLLRMFGIQPDKVVF